MGWAYHHRHPNRIKQRATRPWAGPMSRGGAASLAGCCRSFSQGSALTKGLVALIAILVLLYGLSCAFRSDEEVIEDMVDEARDALVERRGDDFLAFFRPDVVYRDGHDFEALRHEVARWNSQGVGRVWIRERKVTVLEDSGRVELTVAVGASMLQTMPVEVTLELEREGDGWRVSRFQWKRM